MIYPPYGLAEPLGWGDTGHQRLCVTLNRPNILFWDNPKQGLYLTHQRPELDRCGVPVTKSVYTQQYRRFRALLIQARKAAGLTQVELAARLDRP